MWELLGLFNGFTLLLLVLGVAAYGWWYLAISSPAETAYSPTTEGQTIVAKLRPLQCEVKGCGGFRSHRHLVCPACWRRVPKHLRADVYRSWDAFQAGRPNGYLRWMSARQKCLESLE